MRRSNKVYALKLEGVGTLVQLVKEVLQREVKLSCKFQTPF